MMEEIAFFVVIQLSLFLILLSIIEEKDEK
jgi:hypothetical protein